jgi:hypothetical protein
LGIRVAGGLGIVPIQYVGTKVSGTVAGTATLFGSIDGINFVQVPTTLILEGVNAYTNTNVTTNTIQWTLNKNPYLYYRVAVVGSGTMVLTATAYVLAQR